MHKLYMHHGVALRGGHANRSAKLGWQKERARPARSYCEPMMHFCRPGPEVPMQYVPLIGEKSL